MLKTSTLALLLTMLFCVVSYAEPTIVKTRYGKVFISQFPVVDMYEHGIKPDSPLEDFDNDMGVVLLGNTLIYKDDSHFVSLAKAIHDWKDLDVLILNKSSGGSAGYGSHLILVLGQNGYALSPDIGVFLNSKITENKTTREIGIQFYCGDTVTMSCSMSPTTPLVCVGNGRCHDTEDHQLDTISLKWKPKLTTH